MDVISPPPRAGRLSIIHFLGWMLGCAVVFTIYRFTKRSFNPGPLPSQLLQMGCNIAYGTALSSLVLFAWRWRTGSGPLPTQPGHWLLVLCGVAYLVGVMPHQLMLSLAFPKSWYSWLWEFTLPYWIAFVIGVVFCRHLRGAPRLWPLLTVVAVIVFSVNALTGAAALLSEAIIFVPPYRLRGSWLTCGKFVSDLPWWTPLAGPIVCLPILWAADAVDRAQGRHRDWLHNVGIANLSLLGLSDLSYQLYWHSLVSW